MALLFGDQVLNAWNPALTQTISEMSPELIFKEYAKSIGIGGIAMAGVHRYRALMGHYKECCGTGRQRDGRQEGGSKRHPHAERPFHENNRLRVHLHHPTVLFFFDVMPGNVLHSIVAILLVAGIAFLFTTVAANAIAIVGTNPVSGMTLMTLILASVVIVAVGLKGATGMVAALVMGGVVCTALSMAGGFITDLKIGYWLGGTPAKPETWKLLARSFGSNCGRRHHDPEQDLRLLHRRIGSSAGQRDGSRNRPADERCRRSLAALRNRRCAGIGADLLQSTRTGFCAGYVHSTGIEPAVAGRWSGELVLLLPAAKTRR